MRTLFAFALCALITGSVFAQITLNQSNAPSIGQTDSKHAAGTETFTGTTGSGNINWDMTSYNFGSTGGTEYIDPATTIFADSFPTATVATTIPGTSTYSYMRVASNGIWYLGFGTELGGGITNIADVDALMLPFPCTNNTTWTGVIRVTYEPIPGFSSVSIDSTIYTVNAWGNLTTPLWTESALRILSHGYVTGYLNGQPVGPTTESWDYQWITADPMRSMSFSNSGATGPEYTVGDLIYTTAATVDVDPIRGPIAENFKLSQNYPNPFNPSTTLPIEMAKSGKVELTIYNEMGQVVSQMNYDLGAGQHELPIDGSAWSTGSYFAKVMTGSEAQTTKMVLVK